MLSFIREQPITTQWWPNIYQWPKPKNVSNITQDLYLIHVYEPDDQAIHKWSGPGS